MAESQVLKQKISELEAAVAEVQRELARADATRRSDAHHRLAGLVREAREWLDSGGGREPEGEQAAADARTAEGFLHRISMRRTEL